MILSLLLPNTLHYFLFSIKLEKDPSNYRDCKGNIVYLHNTKNGDWLYRKGVLKLFPFVYPFILGLRGRNR